jgi:uncharacterized membrane protein YedE/YeeE
MAQRIIITQKQSERSLSAATYTRVLAVGIYFGIVLIKTEVVRWQRVHDMFLFREPYMYLVLGTAIAVGGIAMLLIRRFSIRDMTGKSIVYQAKPYHKGVIFGGFIFGMGWAITGACPGPIYAQIGAGEWPALLTFLGALGGMYLYGWLRPRLPH